MGSGHVAGDLSFILKVGHVMNLGKLSVRKAMGYLGVKVIS